MCSRPASIMEWDPVSEDLKVNQRTKYLSLIKKNNLCWGKRQSKCFCQCDLSALYLTLMYLYNSMCWGRTIKICEPFLLPYSGHLLLHVKSFPRVFFFPHNRKYRNILHIHLTPRKKQTPSNFSHSKWKKQEASSSRRGEEDAIPEHCLWKRNKRYPY